MDFDIRIKGKNYNIKIIENNDDLSVKVGDKSFNFGKEKKIKKNENSISDFGKQQRQLLNKEIKASISGEASEIFVKSGDSIKTGQKILTLLAMKMENEIISDNDGKIKKIMVKPSQSVREGEVLVILE
ncbi:acetyl-CoA carboxylase biotin carboxyl carrier protein subunit [bacterium]|nr:acetyl-CoA carboxylase biotin carboxyl carrier protein subunit [bacterium]